MSAPIVAKAKKKLDELLDAYVNVIEEEEGVEYWEIYSDPEQLAGEMARYLAAIYEDDDFPERRIRISEA